MAWTWGILGWMKILKREQTAKNLIVFILLSFYYLYLVHSSMVGHGVLDRERFENFVLDEKLLAFVCLCTAWSVFFVKKFSKILFLFFISLVSMKSSLVFYQEGNKVVLIGMFFYVVTAFVLWVFWVRELDSSVFNPNYRENQVSGKNRYNLRVGIKNAKDVEYRGFLTNCDEFSCFAHLKGGNARELKGLVSINVSFLGKEFHALGRVVTEYADGFGIKLVESGQKQGMHLGWSEFYAIITDRGILV